MQTTADLIQVYRDAIAAHSPNGKIVRFSYVGVPQSHFELIQQFAKENPQAVEESPEGSVFLDGVLYINAAVDNLPARSRMEGWLSEQSVREFEGRAALVEAVD